MTIKRIWTVGRLELHLLTRRGRFAFAGEPEDGIHLQVRRQKRMTPTSQEVKLKSSDGPDPFDYRERLIVANQAGCDGRGISSESVGLMAALPSIAGVERRSQLFLSDGRWAIIGTLIAEAQDIQASIVLGHPSQARHVSWSLVAVKGVEQTAVQHRLESAPQALQMKRISRGELRLIVDSTVAAFSRRSPAPSQLRQRPELAIPAGRCEEVSPVPQPPRDRSGESPLRCYTYYCRLRLTNSQGAGPC